MSRLSLVKHVGWAPFPHARTLVVLLLALGPLGGKARAEIVYLKKGDVIHGTLVGVTETRVTLQTPYGRLVIPKKDIEKIEYQAEGESQAGGPERPGEAAKKEPVSPPPPPKPPRSVVSLQIRGRSFWYAFESPPENPADVSVRLRFFLGDVEAATLLDAKPDTVDGATYYNSFTFSPSDSQVARTADGFGCSVQEAEGGKVVLRLELPEGHRDGSFIVRMEYQVNQGTRQLPRWTDAVARSFPIQVETGKETYVVVEQNAETLDYSGFFRRSMKNLESFQLSVVSAEVRPIPREPER